MLREQDLSIIQRDKAIPGLSCLLDPDKLRQLLAHSPLKDPGELKEGYLRYKPGQSCIARYRFDMDGREHFAYAKAFAAEGGLKLKKARARMSFEGPLGPGGAILEQAHIQFSVFPNDVRLKNIGKLADQSNMQALLTRLFKSQPGWETATLSQLNYKPERRYVARLTGNNGASALLKFYSRPEFLRVLDIHKCLKPGSEVLFPPLIGYSKSYRALAFSWLPGTTLRHLTAEARLGSVGLAGQALARIHQLPQSGLRPRARELLGERLLSQAREIGFILPKLADESRALASRMSNWWISMHDPALPVHGDFYDKQVVVGADGVNLIDLDDAHLGNPLKDVACFIAHLERNAINHSLDPDSLEAMSAALLDGYRKVIPEMDLGPLDKLVAICLFQLVHNPFRDRVPDWPEQTVSLVQRCSALFDGQNHYR